MQNAINSPEKPADNAEPNPQQKLQEVEDLTNSLRRLLVQNEIALDEEGIRREVETLEHWMESYRRGLTAANKISETGVEWLSKLRDRLKLAAEERQRIEGEGGNPASLEQTKKTEELFEAARRIDKAIPDLEQMFVHTTPQEEHEPA